MIGNVRVIAKLEIKGPNVVKGIQFDGFRVLGLAHELAERYYAAGIDEIQIQDVVASLYQRDALLEVVNKIAKKVFIPITVGGGIRSIEDIRRLLHAGADKVSLNTAIVANPDLIREAAQIFGSQCVVAAIDTYKKGDRYEVWVDYGREVTTIEALAWAQEVERLGAGEVALTSINRDGLGQGFDCELIAALGSRVSIPVIAAGGAGKPEHLVDAVKVGQADAVAAASLFHYANIPKSNNYEQRPMPLRMGGKNDIGNWDFFYEGYGHQRAINVTPCEIHVAKRVMIEHGVPVRMDGV